jgi:putative heme iron utilization protein
MLIEQFRRAAQILAFDHSFKVPKRLATVLGEPMFDALFQGVNEYGEIVMLLFTYGSGHKVLRRMLLNWVQVNMRYVASDVMETFTHC